MVSSEEAARNTVAKVLEDLCIATVILVDDDFGRDIEFNEVEADLMKLRAEKPQAFTKIICSINASENPAVQRTRIQAAWRGMSVSEKRKKINTISKILEGERLNGALDSLISILPRNKIREMTPRDWSSQGKDIISAANENNRILCFFDQDLGGGSGFDGAVEGTGMSLLKGLLKEHPDVIGRTVICALLSGAFSAGQEIATWQSLSGMYGVDRRYFLPISKDSTRTHSILASAVCKTTINLYCEEMKEISTQSIRESCEKAIVRFSEIDVYDFEYALLQSSDNEGVSEAETAIRVFESLQRDEMKRSMLASHNVGKFHAAANIVRKISGAGRAFRDQRPDNLWQLRQEELYEPSDLVNQFHSPVRNGDIFCDPRQPGQLYILLGQPCDLMVRQSGEREIRGTARVTALAPLERCNSESWRSKGERVFGLKYIYDNCADYGVVDFAAAALVNLNVLDLAALNTDGSCSIALSAEISPEEKMPPNLAWKTRKGKITEYYSSIMRDIKKISEIQNDELKERVIHALLPPFTDVESIRDNLIINEDGFNFSFKRSGRVREPVASHMLAAFGRYLVRDAVPHDTAKGLI